MYDRKAHGYSPSEYYHNNGNLKGVIDRISSGYFSHGNGELFQPIVDQLMNDDPYMLMADYQAYVDCQDAVSQAYRDQENWTRMSILNSARMGKFSSDRTIAEYCNEIWNVKPVDIKIEEYNPNSANN